MRSDPLRPAVSAEAFTAVVDAYADRVHDDARRAGCSTAEAVEVVVGAAFRVLELTKTAPEQVDDVAGAWFREARRLARRTRGAAAGPGADVAPAEGIVAASDDDALARAVLARLENRDRAALLLRDSYALPYPGVAVALGVPLGNAPAIVARARLRFAAARDGADPAQVSATEHDRQIGETAQFAESQLPPKQAHSAGEHLARCDVCAAADRPMRDVRRLLSGLAVVAMPEADRVDLVSRIARAAERELPSAAQLAAARAAAAEARPLVPRTLVAGCLAGALVLGALVGALTGDARTTQAADAGPDVIPTATDSPGSESPSASPSPSASATRRPTGQPSTTGRPTPTATAPTGSATPTASATSFGPARITLDPPSGPNCAVPIWVAGRNWQPGRRVTITYRDLVDRVLTSTSATPSADGRFRVRLTPCDPSGLPGPHQVRATNGNQRAEATYTAGP